MIVTAKEAMQKNALFVKLLHEKKTKLEKTEAAAAKAAAEQQYTETAAEQPSSSSGTSFASMARWFRKSTSPATATTVHSEPRVTAAQSTTALINSFSL